MNLSKFWHPNTEEPEEDKQVLVCFELSKKNRFCYVCFYHKAERRFFKELKPSFGLNEINSWGYIDELLENNSKTV